MDKSALLLILSACLAVACSSSSKQSYNEESSEIQENIEQSDEAQEQVKREPELPNGRIELYQQMRDEGNRLKVLTHDVEWTKSHPINDRPSYVPAKVRFIRKQYYEREERAELIIAYETYKGKLYDLYNKSQTEEESKFYYEEINKLEESWDEYRIRLNQFDEAIEKAMTD